MKKTLKRADPPQLRAELAEAGFAVAAVSEPDAEGRVTVTAPDETDGALLDGALARHFPRSLVAAITAVDFESVDFDTPTTIAGLKAALNQLKQRHVELRNRTAKALRARWE